MAALNSFLGFFFNPPYLHLKYILTSRGETRFETRLEQFSTKT